MSAGDSQSGRSSSDPALDRLLDRARVQMDLDADTERELLDELRGHLEESAAAARRRGLTQEQALADAAERVGLEEAGRELQTTHLGWGTADGVLAAGLPVVCTLVLRWLILPRGGGLVHIQQVLARPEFWGIAVMALLLPLLKFRRWGYALASWAFFWTLSMAFLIGPALAH